MKVHHVTLRLPELHLLNKKKQITDCKVGQLFN